MKRVAMSALTLFSITLVYYGCKKSENNPAPGLARFSGIWSGTVNAVPNPIGSPCTQSPSLWTTRQLWVVNDNGSVTITDTIKTPPNPTRIQTWVGTIDNNLQLNVFTSWDRSISCGPSLPMNMNDKLISTTNSTSLKDTIDFPLCPSIGCNFKLHYSILRE